jgi:HD superfamily phosphohydrolases
MKKEKVFRDPIHQYIYINDDVIWQLINTRAFQRLNNIKQLGGSYQVFHGAMHTRFGHSLGAYAIAKDMYEKVPQLATEISEYERIVLFCAALLHDLGHGPYSHAAEKFIKLHHEDITCKIIEEDCEIRSILDDHNRNLAKDIIAVLQKKYQNPILSQLISSQVDVDRMDYLLRDSHYAGVPYGRYDKDRIIRVIKIRNGLIYFTDTGIHALENFMISRYHMRQQVYNNSKGRSFEIMVQLAVERFIKLWHENKIEKTAFFTQFYKFLSVDETSNIADFIRFDDHTFTTVLQLLAESPDNVLQELATNIVHRHLFEAYIIEDEAMFIEYQQQILAARENDQPFGYQAFTETTFETSIYSDNKDSGIHVLKPDDSIIPIETISPIIRTLQQESTSEKYYLYMHKKFAIDKNSKIVNK